MNKQMQLFNALEELRALLHSSEYMKSVDENVWKKTRIRYNRAAMRFNAKCYWPGREKLGLVKNKEQD